MRMRFICAHVSWAGVSCLPRCGVVFFRHRLRVADVVVMGECSLGLHAPALTCMHTHTHIGGWVCAWGDRGQLVLKEQINQAFTPLTHRRQHRQTENKKATGGNVETRGGGSYAGEDL